MIKLPTDRQILKCIYEMYKSDYPVKISDETSVKTDPYLPIDIKNVASSLDCLPEMLFGRLYYHLDAKYRYEQDSGACVNLFSVAVGSERHCVNFPYLAAVLSEKSEEHTRQLWSFWFSVVALILSVVSIASQLA